MLFRSFAKGFDRFLNSTELVVKGFNIYNGNSAAYLDNARNFEKRLRPLLEKSFVEVVNESLFYEHEFSITEKTLHTFLGCNIPIWIGSPGTVSAVRDLGFDVFDDIVDHSYDNDYNIVDRIYKVVYNNRLILGNSDLAKQTWQQVQDRIERNADRAKNLFSQADLMLDQKFAKIKWK